MEEKYDKILSGEINIKYLSPNDLLELEQYLDKKRISLKNLLDNVKTSNDNLLNEMNKLEEILNYEET